MDNKYYACAKTKLADGSETSVRMHRLIMGVTDSKKLVEHKDQNPLNNRRGNLRFATNGQNGANRSLQRNNTSGYKGVCRNRSITLPWTAGICKDSKKYYLGSFATPEEAGRAYDKAARELHGEFACLNFPDES